MQTPSPVLALKWVYTQLVFVFHFKSLQHIKITVQRSNIIVHFSWGPLQQQAFDSMKEKLCTAPVLTYPNFKLPFILTTDASKIAVAAILSQVQDGAERPIAYTSRQMNNAEQRYAASEAEMLALVWATKHFRCYLYGNKFLVRADHSALTYLQNFADHNSRLLRWSIKQSELDFVVEHRPGFKIGHVDALNRHVGTIKHEAVLSKEIVLRQRFPYFLRRGALFRREIRHGALSSPLYQRHICAYLAVFSELYFTSC